MLKDNWRSSGAYFSLWLLSCCRLSCGFFLICFICNAFFFFKGIFFLYFHVQAYKLANVPWDVSSHVHNPFLLEIIATCAD